MGKRSKGRTASPLAYLAVIAFTCILVGRLVDEHARPAAARQRQLSALSVEDLEGGGAWRLAPGVGEGRAFSRGRGDWNSGERALMGAPDALSDKEANVILVLTIIIVAVSICFENGKEKLFKCASFHSILGLPLHTRSLSHAPPERQYSRLLILSIACIRNPNATAAAIPR